MNVGSPPEWEELAKQWKSEPASISVDDLQRHVRRNRLQVFAVVIAELLACAIGIATAMWLVLSTPMLFVGLGFGFAITIFAVVALRWQWSALPIVGEDAIKALDAVLNREERTLEILAAGRVVILVALAAVVIAASHQLTHFRGGTLSGLLPLIASSLYLVAASIGRALLARTARQRAAVFLRLREQLRDGKEPGTGSSLDGRQDT